MFADVVEKLRSSFKSGRTKQLKWRKQQLWNFVAMLRENKKEICDAIFKDVRKHPHEAELMEIAQVQNEIMYLLGTIDELAKPEKPSKSLLSILNPIHIRKEPFGVCLIIGAWNYPLLLALQPMVGAIAAGNCVLLKPSEVSCATAELLQKLIPKYLDNDCFSVVVTGPEGSASLVKDNRFDFILYTGSANIGRFIMQCASKHLTPVVLELGGKNPCYVDKSCSLDSAVRCITWGKWTNAGQTCIAPDYIICDASVKEKFIEKLKASIAEQYGEEPRKSSSYGRIVNERHVRRLECLLEGADVIHGGVINEEDLYFSPTLVTGVKEDAPLRTNEVFGPILPIYEVKDVDEAIEFMTSHEAALQISIFATERKVIDKMIASTQSGGVTINELLMQMSELDLPFGGFGGSGMGRYHGKYSYETFSHRRGCYEGKTPEIINRIKYPPYTNTQLSLLKPFIYRGAPLSSPVKTLLMLSLLGLLGLALSYFYHKSM